MMKLFGRRHISIEDLSEYLDGRLDSRRQARVETHLHACAACQQELAALRATVALLRRVPVAEAPRSFVFQAPPAAAPQRVASARSGGIWALPAAAAASLALLVAVVSADVTGILVVPGPRDVPSPTASSTLPAPTGTPTPNERAFGPSSVTETPSDDPSMTSLQTTTADAAQEGATAQPQGDAPPIPIASDTGGAGQPGTPAWVRALEAALAVMVVGLGAASLAAWRRARAG